MRCIQYLQDQRGASSDSWWPATSPARSTSRQSSECARRWSASRPSLQAAAVSADSAHENATFVGISNMSVRKRERESVRTEGFNVSRRSPVKSPTLSALGACAGALPSSSEMTLSSSDNSKSSESVAGMSAIVCRCTTVVVVVVVWYRYRCWPWWYRRYRAGARSLL
mgnify:CR=1 FL=1